MASIGSESNSNGINIAMLDEITKSFDGWADENPMTALFDHPTGPPDPNNVTKEIDDTVAKLATLTNVAIEKIKERVAIIRTRVEVIQAHVEFIKAKNESLDCEMLYNVALQELADASKASSDATQAWIESVNNGLAEIAQVKHNETCVLADNLKQCVIAEITQTPIQSHVDEAVFMKNEVMKKEEEAKIAKLAYFATDAQFKLALKNSNSANIAVKQMHKLWLTTIKNALTVQTETTTKKAESRKIVKAIRKRQFQSNTKTKSVKQTEAKATDEAKAEKGKQAEVKLVEAKVKPVETTEIETTEQTN